MKEPRITQINTDKRNKGMEGKLIHGELSESIIGAAMHVLNELRPGLDEKIYENALVIELGKRGHQIEQQRRFPVRYHGHLVGTLVPDLIIDEVVVVDTKVVSSFVDKHVAKMIGYLAITELSLAILVNFHDASLEWKRVVR